MTIRDELAAIRERAENATEGPWEAHEILDCHPGTTVEYIAVSPTDWGDLHFIDVEPEHGPDATFIAHARTDIPRLVNALQAVVDRHVRSPLVYLGDDGEYSVCQGCARRWPCPTIRVIEEAMEAWA